jgi:hypothetical protein
MGDPPRVRECTVNGRQHEILKKLKGKEDDADGSAEGKLECVAVDGGN